MALSGDLRSFGISPAFGASEVASAAIGGALLGLTVIFKTGSTGEVLGVSGSTRGLLMTPNWNRAAFIIGLIVAGIVSRQVYGGVEPMPPQSTMDSVEDRALFIVRLVCGGFLVGFGASLGNGCTSGHGLTGLARLTWRSWLAVPCFMFTGAVTATCLGTSRALPPVIKESQGPTAGEAAAWAGCAAAVLLLMLALFTFAASRISESVAMNLKILAEFISGLTFGFGLSISTMGRPSKVGGFLDFGSGVWDPSLAFVMGGALMLTFPFYQVLERRPSAAPLLGGNFGLPPKGKPVDRSLILGSALFGAGWGTCGLCPGPTWVLIGAAPTFDTMGLLIGMLAGIGTWVIWQKLENRRTSTSSCMAVKPAFIDNNCPAHQSDIQASTSSAKDAGATQDGERASTQGDLQ